MIVIACNTVSSAAYDVLLDFLKGRCSLSMVDPLVQSVVNGGYKNVGVIATKATINSSIYKNKIKTTTKGSKVNQIYTTSRTHDRRRFLFRKYQRISD